MVSVQPIRQRRKEARPGELTAAALELFVERGFAATRLDDVAGRAGDDGDAVLQGRCVHGGVRWRGNWKGGRGYHSEHPTPFDARRRRQ